MNKNDLFKCVSTKINTLFTAEHCCAFLMWLCGLHKAVGSGVVLTGLVGTFLDLGPRKSSTPLSYRSCSRNGRLYICGQNSLALTRMWQRKRERERERINGMTSKERIELTHPHSCGWGVAGARVQFRQNVRVCQGRAETPPSSLIPPPSVKHRGFAPDLSGTLPHLSSTVEWPRKAIRV